ncbi:MAG: hypothetical protein ABW221_22185 [Vicinamibacteria bacterium]
MLGLGFALASGRAALADVWDVQSQSDNTVGTENELVHGSDQLHDLGALPGPAADQDWYRISQKPFSSYEIVADATSGDIGTTLNVNRTDAAGTGVLQSSQAVGVGYSRSLRWVNATSAAEDTQRIAVTSGSCTTNCGSDDVYRLRAYETTYAVPRFNNSGTQVTVLLLQNPTNYQISGTVYFWSAAGAPAGTSAFVLAPKALQVLNTSTVAPATSGALTIAHDGRYGDLSGKSVALEPATGFSFDTPALARVH